MSAFVRVRASAFVCVLTVGGRNTSRMSCIGLVILVEVKIITAHIPNRV